METVWGTPTSNSSCSIRQKTLTVHQSRDIEPTWTVRENGDRVHAQRSKWWKYETIPIHVRLSVFNSLCKYLLSTFECGGKRATFATTVNRCKKKGQKQSHPMLFPTISLWYFSRGWHVYHTTMNKVQANLLFFSFSTNVEVLSFYKLTVGHTLCWPMIWSLKWNPLPFPWNIISLGNYSTSTSKCL